MDAVTTVPSPTNEPPLHFAPGSPERARLELRLKEMSGEQVGVDDGARHPASDGWW